MLLHAHHRRGLKQLDVVAQVGRERAIHLDYSEGEVKWGTLLSIDQRLQPESLLGRDFTRFRRRRFPGLARLLEDKEGLEERGVAGVTPGLQPLDQQGKRIVLMVQRADDRLADAAQQFLEGGIAREV